MSDDEAFGSDSSDDDYVPIEGEAVSEEEGSGDEEDTALLAKDAEEGEGDGKQKKKSKKKKEFGRGKRLGGIKLDDEGEQKEETKEDKVDFNEEDKKAKEQQKAEKEKKKADDLWASFMSDVGGPKPKAKTTSSIGSLCTVKKPASSSTVKPFLSPSASKPSPGASSNKVTITKEYDFAGETIKVTKEVDANSSEAKNQQKNESKEETKASEKPVIGMKRPGGLGSLVGKLSKAPKISTLDKSKLDWDNFKQTNNLTEELTNHNRGKEGFLERKAFLERTDLRQFEIEKSLRLSNSKR